MDLKYKLEDLDKDQSFHIKREHVPYYEGNWHCHKEFELIYIIRGEGVRIVGDNLSNFGSPQLVLVGPWVPHLWKNFETEEDDTVDLVIVKFDQTIGGMDIFSMPEFKNISELLKRSYKGLCFGTETTTKLQHLILNMSNSTGSDRVINLLLTLKHLSESEDYSTLTSPDYITPVFVKGEDRLTKIMNYISDNFTEQISLEQLASFSAMTPSSLCRFFKDKTNKTVFQVINELRIGKACQMFISGHQSITEVCFNSGFNSVTSFNRDFKNLKKITPRAYKEKYHILNK